MIFLSPHLKWWCFSLSVSVCVCVCVKARGRYQPSSSIAFYLTSLRRVFHLIGSLPFRLGWLTMVLEGSFCLLVPQCYGYRHIWPCLLFSMGTGDSNSSPLLVQQVLLATEPLPQTHGKVLSCKAGFLFQEDLKRTRFSATPRQG